MDISAALWILLCVLWLAAPFVLIKRSRLGRIHPELQPTIYEDGVLVRAHRVWRGDADWIEWASRFGGGPKLIVSDDKFEVVAPQGMMLSSRDLVIESSTATMWRDRMGLWGFMPVGVTDCIHVEAPDHRFGRMELALTSKGSIQEALGCACSLRRSGPQLVTPVGCIRYNVTL